MSEDLTQQKCVPCQGGIPPFDQQQIEKHLPKLKNNWQVVDGKKLVIDFAFKDFVSSIDFIDKVAKIAEAQGHHPNLRLHDYKNVEVELYTHKINGLHLNDFIVAAQIEDLL